MSARALDLQRGIHLEYFGLAYNVLEAAVGVAAGIAAGSVALVAFGLDAVVESASAVVLILRFRSERTGARTSQEAEARAVRLVAGAFVLLAVYVGTNAVVQLVRGEHAETSAIGIGLACLSLIVMPYLAYRKTRLAKDLGSRSLRADSRQTILCTYLSGRSCSSAYWPTPCWVGGGRIPLRRSRSRRSRCGRDRSCGVKRISVNELLRSAP